MAEVKLSPEKQFELKAFECRIAGLSADQLRSLCLKLHESLICQAAVYQELIGVKWGIVPRSDGGADAP
jgi:hypothetical protein